MKRLPVTAPPFQYIEKSFKEWLEALGYSWQGVYYMPIQIRGLLNWLERQNKTQLADITTEAITNYYYNELKQSGFGAVMPIPGQSGFKPALD